MNLCGIIGKDAVLQQSRLRTAAATINKLLATFLVDLAAVLSFAAKHTRKDGV